MSAPLAAPASDRRSQVVQPETNADQRRGFVQLPRTILFNADLSPGARITYAALLSYSWGKGECFPSQERLAEELGVSGPTVRAYLRELEAASLLRRKRRGQGKTTVYFLSVEAERACVPDRKRPENQDRKNLSVRDVEVQEARIHTQEQPPPPPPTPEPQPEQPTAGGGIRRLRSATADDLTDHGDRNANADRPKVQDFLEKHGVFEHIAAAWAQTDYDPMIAGRIVKQAERDGATGGKLVWRLKHEAVRVEREIAAEAKAEERKQAEKAEEERQRERDRDARERLRNAWAAFGQVEPTWNFLLNPHGEKPMVSATVGEARAWALQNTLTFTEMPESLVGRVKALIAEGKVPAEAKAVIDRAFARPMPQAAG